MFTSWTDREGTPGPPCNAALVRPHSNDSYHQYMDERDITVSRYVRRSRLNVWICERRSCNQALMTYRGSRKSSSLSSIFLYKVRHSNIYKNSSYYGLIKRTCMKITQHVCDTIPHIIMSVFLHSSVTTCATKKSPSLYWSALVLPIS